MATGRNLLALLTGAGQGALANRERARQMSQQDLANALAMGQFGLQQDQFTANQAATDRANTLEDQDRTRLAGEQGQKAGWDAAEAELNTLLFDMKTGGGNPTPEQLDQFRSLIPRLSPEAAAGAVQGLGGGHKQPVTVFGVPKDEFDRRWNLVKQYAPAGADVLTPDQILAPGVNPVVALKAMEALTKAAVPENLKDVWKENVKWLRDVMTLAPTLRDDRPGGDADFELTPDGRLIDLRTTPQPGDR